MLKDYKIKLTIKTVSPIAIIENNDTEPGGNIVTRIKKTVAVVRVQIPSPTPGESSANPCGSHFFICRRNEVGF